jgi:tetratricopeptide (TPR) repeat protein
MPGGLLGQLANIFQQRRAQAPMPAPAQPTLSQQGATWPQAAPDTSSMPSSSSSGSTATVASPSSSGATEQQDPIVSQLNQQLAAEQTRPVPTEDEQLQQEQHAAWGAYDFERCIVIFSRLRQLHPEDPNWADKLKLSYFNRGKQYETEGNEERAVACYYSALSIDPDFPEAKEAAEALVERHKAESGTNA